MDFADVYTHPRLRQYGGRFGGGVNGGMDDRFDQILLSPALLSRYLPGSYTSFGNDGNHFNDSINAMPNTAVSPELAQALHDASDHLPVYLDLVFEKNTTSAKMKRCGRGGYWICGGTILSRVTIRITKDSLWVKHRECDGGIYHPVGSMLTATCKRVVHMLHTIGR
ncbi:MAG: hypothetical protein R3F28_12555 [Candidatus Kapaibacterium sp.]